MFTHWQGKLGNSLFLVCTMYFFRFAHVLFKDSNGSNPSTDTLPRVARVLQAIISVDSGPDRFSIISHMVEYGSNAPQTSTISWSLLVIKSVLWLVSSGCLVAEIWSFQVLGWCGAPKTKFTFDLHAVV